MQHMMIWASSKTPSPLQNLSFTNNPKQMKIQYAVISCSHMVLT